MCDEISFLFRHLVFSTYLCLLLFLLLFVIFRFSSSWGRFFPFPLSSITPGLVHLLPAQDHVAYVFLRDRWLRDIGLFGPATGANRNQRDEGHKSRAISHFRFCPNKSGPVSEVCLVPYFYEINVFGNTVRFTPYIFLPP